MIVVVCANPALDVTYGVDRLVPGTVHRAYAVSTRAGGKGTNVVRVLRQLGHRAALVAPLGGLSGATFVDLLGADDLISVPVEAPTRSSVAVVDDLGATVVNERGTALRDDEWLRVVTAVTDAVSDGDVVVLAGSLPVGVPVDAYGRLVTALPKATCVLDTSGAALAATLPFRPAVVAPNVHEIREATGGSDLSASDAALLLQRRGAGVTVVSDGPDGISAAVGDELWQVAPPRAVEGNPTGAGDALTAALAAGLHGGLAWPQLLCDAVATSAAAVATPVGGEIDASVLREFRDLLRPESLRPSPARVDLGSPR